jgi:hypothetical protein
VSKATIYRWWNSKEQPYGRVIAGFVAHAQTDPAFATLYREQPVMQRRRSDSVPLAGLEPATRGLEVRRSVQLSYRGCAEV